MDRSSISGGDAGGGGDPAAGKFAPPAIGALGLKWSALHDAASIVAAVASVETAASDPRVKHFPAEIRESGDWRQRLAEQGIEDLIAILEPGLAALLAVHGRGVDPQPAALALWHEFVSARDALLDLVPSPESGPLRPA